METPFRNEVIEIKIRNAYQKLKHKQCVDLIDSLSDRLKNTTQYKILKASCLNNIIGRAGEAMTILEDVIEADPRNSLALFGKGLVCITQGDHRAAVKCFEHAIELEPGEKMDKARAMKARTEKILQSLTKREPPAKAIDNWSCTVCFKSFTKNFSLMRHMLLHTGERPFQCQICSYGFIQKSDLLRHEATHRSEFNFHCLYCTKKFKTKKNLHCHLVIHSESRPFQCTRCPKRFKTQRLFFHHSKLHSINQFQCDLCAKQFNGKLRILAHLQMCHLGKEENIALEPLDIKTEPIQEEFSDTDESFNSQTQLNTEIFIKKEPVAIKIKQEKMEIEDIDENVEQETVSITDADLEFFKSLINDVKKMNEKQKEEFRFKTRNVFKEILN